MTVTALSPQQRQAILRDYRRKNPKGGHRHTAEWVAEKHGVSLAEVEALRREAGTAPNGASGFRLWSCPLCSFRALHPLGHAVCMGDEELAEVEASQALQAVDAHAMLEQEVA